MDFKHAFVSWGWTSSTWRHFLRWAWGILIYQVGLPSATWWQGRSWHGRRQSLDPQLVDLWQQLLGAAGRWGKWERHSWSAQYFWTHSWTIRPLLFCSPEVEGAVCYSKPFGELHKGFASSLCNPLQLLFSPVFKQVFGLWFFIRSLSPGLLNWAHLIVW